MIETSSKTITLRDVEFDLMMDLIIKEHNRVKAEGRDPQRFELLRLLNNAMMNGDRHV